MLLQAEQLSQFSSKACHQHEGVPAGYDTSPAVRCDITIDTVMRRVVAAILALSATAFVAPIHPPAAPKPQQLVVLRGANDDSSIFSTEKLGKAAFIMVPFLWGVVDWAHPPWYDVVLDAFRG